MREPAIRLSELESCVLGVIWRQQPCSTYAVRRVFAASNTTTWSSSAGTIYPVIAKLEALDLVRAHVLASDARGRRNLSLTAKGVAEMRRWIAELDAASASPVADPIRTRLFFLDALAVKARPAVLDEAVTLTRAALAIAQEVVETQRQKSQMQYLASLGAVYELEARLRWLGEVRKKLTSASKRRASKA